MRARARRDISDFIKRNQDKSDKEIATNLSAEFLGHITALQPNQFEAKLGEIREQFNDKWTKETVLDLCPAKDVLKEFNQWLLANYETDLGCSDILMELEEIDPELEEIIGRICTP